MQTVAKFIARSWRRCGVDVVFGYAGQSNLALLRAAQEEGIRYVQAADERGAGFAAIGYVEASHKPTVVCASKGPAATNLLTALVTAMTDGVPVLVCTGNVASFCRGRSSFQEFDVGRSFHAAGALKAWRECTSGESVPLALEEMWHAAWAAPYGPTLVDIPYDVLSQPLAAEPRALAVPERPRGELPLTVIADVAARLRKAERPLIIVGRGARHHYGPVREFARLYRAPVVHTMGGTGVISTADPLYAGLLRHNGSPLAADLVRRADLVIAIGTGLDDRATAERSSFARNAVHVHVDLRADVLQRQHAAVPLHLDLRDFVEAMLSHARRDESDRPMPRLVSRPVTAARSRSGFLLASEVIGAAAHTLARSVIVKDSGAHKYWTTNLAPCHEPRQSIASCHFGAMGFAVPAAIGASLAVPERQIIAACGDGGLLMSIAELQTVVRERCGNLKILVFNNGGLGSTRDYERRLYGAGSTITDFGGHAPCARLADAFGLATRVISTRDQLVQLEELLASPGAALLDCITDPQEVVPSIPYGEAIEMLADAPMPS